MPNYMPTGHRHIKKDRTDLLLVISRAAAGLAVPHVSAPADLPTHKREVGPRNTQIAA